MSKYFNHKNFKKDVIERRLYQELLTAKALETNTLVVAPTGLGKTIVAVLLIAHIYDENKSMILLSPTKPLIAQHHRSLVKFLNIDEEKIILVTGEIAPEKRNQIYKEKGLVICATPQTINNDLKNNLIDTKYFNLIVFDEAHRATKNYAYCSISNFFSEDIKRLGLTASPGFSKAKIEEVALNLKTPHIEIRTEDDLDVVDYVKEIEIEKIFIELDHHSKELSKIIDQFIEKKITFLQKFGFKITFNYSKKQILDIQKAIFARIQNSKDSINFVLVAQTTQIIKLLHAKELIETQGFFSFKNYINKIILESRDPSASKSVKQLVNSEEFLKINEYLFTHKDDLVYNKTLRIKVLLTDFIFNNPDSKILVFTNFRDNAEHIVNELNKNKEIKAVRFVGQATKINDRGLSQKEQIEIISDFRDGVYNCLVCTSVGEEGLDIPSVDLVVFYDSVPSEIRNIQRRGRTGRFDVGQVYLLINKDTIDEKYFFVAQNKEKRMKQYLQNYNSKKPIKRSTKKKKQKNIFDFT